MTDHKLIILGLGGIGSAAAYWAAKEHGDTVLGIEQFPIGHLNGGSEDHSRIIRLSYHTPGYVEMAKAAFDAWAQVEEDSAEQLILRTGGLDLAPADATIGLTAYRESMTKASVEFEDLEAAEIMRRWPQWRLPEHVTGLYQERSGIAMAARANAAHRKLARENGASFLENTPVTSIRESSEGVMVTTPTGSHHAEKLIIAAGAWTNRLLAHLGVSFPLEVTLEQVVYMRPVLEGLFDPRRFPIWIWMTEPSFYGFPIFGEPAVKIAWDRCEIVTDAETRSLEPREDVTQAIREFASNYLPDANGPLHLAKTCLYTLTPDRDFVADRVPGTERVFTAIGAGHAFKFASLLGRVLVDMALKGETDVDVTPFRADRAILNETHPVRTYMV